MPESPVQNSESTEACNSAWDSLYSASLYLPAAPSADNDAVLWHYTDTVGLVGILQSNRLWATAAPMLNDTSELAYGLSLAEETLSDVLKSDHPSQGEINFLDATLRRAVTALKGNGVYVFCASEAPDDLAQWRGYAGGSGYSIGLHPTQLAVISNLPNLLLQMQAALPSWRRVLYDVTAQRKLLEQSWRAIPGLREKYSSLGKHTHQAIAEGGLVGVVTCLKNPGFRSEREVRFVVDGRNLSGATKFRAGAVGVIPYLELGAGTTSSRFTLVVPDAIPLPAVEVMVGPGHDQDTAERGVRTLLDSAGHAEAKITRSEVPYR